VSKKSRQRGERRRAEQEAQREALAQQFGISTETSKPKELGRSMFLSKREAEAYFSAHATQQQGIKMPFQPSPKKEPT
jgi:hypothetical protein